MVGKSSEREEEYFARMEFERKKKTEEEKQKKMAEREKKRLKELHSMRCPKCGMELIEIDYKGIREISVHDVKEYGLMPENLKLFQRLRRKFSINCSVCSKNSQIHNR